MINAYLIDTVIIKKITYDQWGETSESTEIIKARVIYGSRLVRNFAGEQVVSSAQVMLKNRTLSHADKITFDGIDHAILNISKARGFSYHILIVDVA